MGTAGTPSCSDEEFIALFSQLPSAQAVATHLGVNIKSVFRRRRNLEQKHDIRLTAGGVRERQTADAHAPRLDLEIRNGIAIIGSDIHKVATADTVMQRAFLFFCKEFKPVAVFQNGDVFSGCRISRHPRIGFLESAPSVKDELEAVQDWNSRIEVATPKSCELYWPLGNHDLRFETYLASNAPEMEGVKGMHLKDHFPNWRGCWAAFINKNVVVKHRLKGGVHATHNNTVAAGTSIFTGHLHSAKVTPYSDYNGTRYGVDTGTLGEPYDQQFTGYTEFAPVNWRSALAIVTFKDGRLMQPELAYKWDDKHVEFRGALIRV